MKSFLTVPWYTWVTLALLAIFVAGLLWAIIGSVMLCIRQLFLKSWHWINVLCMKLFGTPLSAHGTAHFAGYWEIRRAGVLRTDGLPLGTWHKHTLHEPQNGHIVLFGPPRSRKSWGMIMPALREFKGSAVITDLRGELFERTHDEREKLGPCWKFDPGNPDSCHVNLLDMVRWNTHLCYGDLHRIIVHLVRPENPFSESAVPLLIAIAIDRYQDGEGNFPAMVRWMTLGQMSLDEKLDHLLTSPDPLVQAGARRCLDMSDRLRASVWNACLTPLDIFADPQIAANTEKSDCTFDQLLYGLQPLSLYLCMGFHDIQRLGVFLGAFVDSLIAILGSPQTPPAHQVLLCLDECANLKKLPELERGVSYLQGSGTQCLITFQNLAQVIDTYGEHSPLLASIPTQVHYTPIDLQTASHISSHLGTSTTAATAIRYAEDIVVSEAQHARALLTVDEVLRFPKHGALVLIEGHPPIVCQKLGMAPPSLSTRVVFQLVQYHRALALGLVLIVALWPLRVALHPMHTALAPTSPLVLAAAVPGPTLLHQATPSNEAPATQQWVLWHINPLIFGSPTGYAHKVADSENACLALLATIADVELANWEEAYGKMNHTNFQAERTKYKRAWSYTSAVGGGKREETSFECKPATGS